MDPIEVHKIVQSITFLKAKPNGGYTAERLTEAGPRKKQSKHLSPVERIIRKMVKKEIDAGKIYLQRHENSNKRKRNGWLKDLGKNLKTAVRKSSKQPKLTLVR